MDAAGVGVDSFEPLRNSRICATVPAYGFYSSRYVSFASPALPISSDLILQLR